MLDFGRDSLYPGPFKATTMTSNNPISAEHFSDLQAKAREVFLKFEELRGFL